MRAIMDKLVRVLGARRLTPSENVVKQFRKDLGVSTSSTVRARLVKIVLGSHRWVREFVRPLPIIGGVVVTTLYSAWFYRYLYLTQLSADWPEVSYSIALIVSLVALAVMGLGYGDRMDEPKNAFYVTLLALFSMGVIGTIVTGGIFLGWLPFATHFWLWLYKGIVISRSDPHTGERYGQEVELGEIFDIFVKKHKPELVDDESKLNIEIQQMNRQIRKAEDLRSNLSAELAVATRRESVHVDDIRIQINRLDEAIPTLKAELQSIENSRQQALSALRLFEAIRNDAVSHLRIESLLSEGDRILGKVKRSRDQASGEIVRIRQSMFNALTQLNEASAKLGLASMSQLDDPNLKLLTRGVDEVLEVKTEREGEIRKLSVV
jgi:hypothetical protein